MKAKPSPAALPSWAIPLLQYLALCLLVAPLAHPTIFHVDQNAVAFSTGDAIAIKQGYLETPHLWHDGLRWWTGPWINQSAPYWRPLISYCHWGQLWLGLNHGWVAVMIVDVLLFASTCAAFGLFVNEWTGNRTLGGLGAFLACFAGSKFVSPPIHYTDALNWWVEIDNFVCLTPGFGALTLFYRSDKTGSKPALAWALVLMLVSCLAKEWGFILPLMFLTIALYNSRPEYTRRLVAFSLVACLLVGAVAAYRRSVVPGALGAMPHPEVALNLLTGFAHTLTTAPGQVFSFLGNHLLDILTQLLYVFVFAGLIRVSTMHFLDRKLLCTFLLFLLALLPLNGLYLWSHRIYFPWIFGTLVLCTVLSQWQNRSGREPGKSPIQDAPQA